MLCKVLKIFIQQKQFKSILKVDSMKEEVNPQGSWTKDSEATECKLCKKEFNIARRKHHCRWGQYH